MGEGELSEVISIAIVVYDFGKFLMLLSFQSGQLSLQNNIELISLFSLSNDVLPGFIFLFLQDVQKLFSK